MMISACMIVLDEEECIARALDSIYPYVDEIVVVDGGSKDSTKEIVSTYAKVVLLENPWPNDFSVQRNIAIECAKGEWLFSLDADEYIMSYTGDMLRGLTVYEGYDAYKFMYKHFLEGKFLNQFDPQYQIRLFRSYCRYVGRFHEIICKNKFEPISVNMEIFHDKKLSWQIKDNQHYWDMGQLPDPGWVKVNGKWILEVNS